MSPAPTDPRNRRRLLALIAAGIVLLLLAGVGVYGLLTGPRTSTSTDPDSEPGPVATAPPSVAPSAPRPPRVPAIPRSANPETFAQGVASTLFAWNTASGLWPLDYTSAILTVGDPSGDEQAGLASDVAVYLPTRDAWIELRQYATRQHLTIDTAYVPDAWADAVAQAQPGTTRGRNDGRHDRGHPASCRGLERPAGHQRASSRVHRARRLRPDLPDLPSAAAISARQPAAMKGLASCSAKPPSQPWHCCSSPPPQRSSGSGY